VAISIYIEEKIKTRLASPTQFANLWVCEPRLASANTFPNPQGWETRLLRRFAPRNDNQASCHCSDNAEDRELEGAPNVIGLYKI